MKSVYYPLAICILLFAAAGFAGCTNTGTAPDTSPVTPAVTIAPEVTSVGSPAGAIRTLGTGHHRKTIPVRLGERFRIRLPEDTASGYAWNITVDPGIIPVSAWSELPAPGAVPPGTGGFHGWELTAAGSGLQTFTASYGPDGQPGSGNTTNFTVTLLVADTQGKLFTARDNGATVAMRMGDPFAVVLQEYPATGTSWEMGFSSGLTLLAERSFPVPATETAGAGVMREWDAMITGRGNQIIYAVPRRPGTMTTGEEDSFLLTIIAR